MPKRSFAALVRKQRESMILDAALTGFNEHGCFRSTVDRVASDVGIGKGTLYRHHGSQEELFGAALSKGLQALVTRCQDLQETYAVTPETRMQAWARSSSNSNR